MNPGRQNLHNNKHGLLTIMIISSKLKHDSVIIRVSNVKIKHDKAYSYLISSMEILTIS